MRRRVYLRAKLHDLPCLVSRTIRCESRARRHNVSHILSHVEEKHLNFPMGRNECQIYLSSSVDHFSQTIHSFVYTRPLCKSVQLRDFMARVTITRIWLAPRTVPFSVIALSSIAFHAPCSYTFAIFEPSQFCPLAGLLIKYSSNCRNARECKWGIISIYLFYYLSFLFSFICCVTIDRSSEATDRPREFHKAFVYLTG